MNNFNEMLLILLGALCSVIGGVIAQWYQAKKARKVRFEEKIGEQQVVVYQKALSVASQLQGMLFQGTPKDAYEFSEKYNSWLCDNIIYLPNEYEQNWKSIRANLRTISRLESTKDEKHVKQLDEAETLIDKLAEQMESVIRKELGRKPIHIKRTLKKKYRNIPDFPD